ncbi:MAG: type I DNA topoisomerase [Bacteroidales bacterium]|nr:type I DNA topoisomerase [Bacteroidales bacterium]MBO7487371.1 type I DNA topoisomerase [Bacteroidales bacterium]
MGENLVIVESPAKAKTIEKFLGKGYKVKSSFGHIRDLSKKKLGVDTEHGFTPHYEISADKRKLVTELKKDAAEASTVWLASDEDREGEAIAWHLFETLGLDSDKTRRIAFHEITKSAILEAIESPRGIDMNLVNAQQARRILDRLVGFELSPILWKKVQPKLSAGRVQSVAVRLIVDKEREISAFKASSFFKVEGTFVPEGIKNKIKGHVEKKFSGEKDALAFLESCKDAEFHVSSIDKKELTRTPAAPFTTSLLQQEAARKLGFSVSQTMTIAQRLYEAGLITYMRTDSVNLSSLAISTAKAFIVSEYGEQYSKPRNYKTRTKGAQEAHEAIRPTYIQNVTIDGTASEKKLYNLIWKRTIASQMADAVLEKTVVDIKASGVREPFVAEAEKVVFDGFLKVYIESTDDEETAEELTLMPSIAKGQKMERKEIDAIERFTPRPVRYTEASLVKKLEELGIGRPSTYAPTISTIMKRGYVAKGDSKGESRSYRTFTLKADNISAQTKTEIVGKEKGKLFAENVGIVVTDYLDENFKAIMDYGFTAQVEQDFDDIANGKRVWNEVISDFYTDFHNTVEEKLNDRTHTHAERRIGIDPASGKVLIARMGRFGPLVQKGENEDPDKRYASMKKGQLIENITVEEAAKLFELPRTVGTCEGLPITASVGRFGPYIKYGSTFVSLGKTYDPMLITEEEAIALIEDHKQKESKKHISAFGDIEVLNGRFGPYIKQGKNNYKIPKGTNPETLDEAACREIIAKASKSAK